VTSHPRILEAGHYYTAKGPTVWAVMGWGIMQGLRHSHDATLLFLDNVHDLNDVHPEEVHLDVVEFDPEADFVVNEGDVVAEAKEVLDRLLGLSRRRRAARNGNGKYFCSGVPLTDEDGNPNCLLLDAGLTLKKQQLGFSSGVNILPIFYEEEQRSLLRIVDKAIPDFGLHVVLYDVHGQPTKL